MVTGVLTSPPGYLRSFLLCMPGIGFIAFRLLVNFHPIRVAAHTVLTTIIVALLLGRRVIEHFVGVSPKYRRS